MNHARRVEPERLDTLPVSDPAAIQSRRDLQRLNLLMGQPASVVRLLTLHAGSRPIRRVVDLGGGDGTLLLRVARRLAPQWGRVQAVVVDRHMLMSAGTGAEFERLGWSIEAAASDVFEWVARAPLHEGTAMISNLFVHHFPDPALRDLLCQIAARAELFVACEPRRSRLALGASRLVGWIGCNSVTRHDATVSVRAGFAGRELSALWPGGEEWEADEGSTGPFSHYFVASRRPRTPAQR